MTVTGKSRGTWVVGDLVVLDDLTIADDISITGDITIAGDFAIGESGAGSDLTIWGDTAGSKVLFDASDNRAEFTAYCLQIAGTTVDAISISGTETGNAINITGAPQRAICVGTKTTGLAISTSGYAIDTDPNNYMFGLFSAVTGDESALTDELRGAWIRTRVDAGCDIGQSAGYGYGVCGAESQLKIYGSGGTETNIRSWQASGLWAQLETQGDSVHFEDGCVAASVLAMVGLTATTVIESGAVVAGVAIKTNSATADVTTTGDYVGMYISSGAGTKLAFEKGIYITDSCSTTGISIGSCATAGITLTGTTGVGIDMSAGTITTDLKLSNGATLVNTSDTLTVEEATTAMQAGTLFGIASPDIRLGYDATDYMKVAVATGTGNVTITHTGTNKSVTWTASGGFDFVGAIVLDGVTISGDVTVSDNATDLIIIPNTTAAFEIYDSTTRLLAFDTRNTVSGVEVIALTPGAATLPDGAASTRNGVVVKSATSTLVGVTGVTTPFDGLSFQVEVPTIAQTGGAVVVDKASTMYIAGAPTAGGSVTITDAIALEIDGGATGLALNGTTTGIDIGSCTTGITIDGTITTGINMEPSAITKAIAVGAESFAASGLGLPLDGVTTHEGVSFYFDDGGTMLAAGYTEALRAGFLVSQAIITADVSLYTAHDYVYLAADVTTAGGVGGTWGSMLVKTGVTITTSSGVCDFSGAHFTCEVPAGATIGTGTWACGVSVGGNLGGDHTGDAAGYRVRVPSAGKWDVGLRIEPTACVEALQVGTASYALSGSGIPLDGSTQHSGAEIYFDDGGSKLLVGYTEAWLTGFLVSTAVTDASVSCSTVHDYIYIAEDVTTSGTFSGSWSSILVKDGATITSTGSVSDFPALHLSVDVPAGATIAASTFACGLSIGGQLGGTHSGNAVGFRLRPANGNWDGLCDITSQVTGSSNGSGNDVYIDCFIDGVAARIAAKYVSI